MSNRRYVTALAALSLLMAACASTTSTTSAPVTSSTAGQGTTTTPAPTPTTTTVGSTTTTHGGELVYRVMSADLSSPDALPGSDGALGSGCAPGAGALPDGIWYGYALSTKSKFDETFIEFDLGCFYTGDVAREKATAAGEEPLDYYIVNQDPTTREVPVDQGATVWSITGDPSEGLEAIALTDWPAAEPTYTNCLGSSCSVWLYVNGGVVTEVQEQYLP